MIIIFKNKIDLFLWSLFFYTSNIYYTGEVRLKFIYFISLILILFLIYFRSEKINESLQKKNKTLILLWFVFSTSVFLTSLLHNDRIFDSFMLITIVPYFFIFKIQGYPNISAILIKSVLCSSVLLVLNAFSIFNIFNVSVHIQTNSVGIFLLLLSIFIFYKYYYNNYYIIAIILNLSLIVLTNSRTALVTFIFCFLTLLFLKTRSKFGLKATINFLTTITLLTIFVTLLFQYKEQLFKIDIMNKFLIYSGQKDVFNGRTLIWRYIWENINFTGHNLSEIYSTFGLSPHSNYLAILFSNGVISFICFILINVIFIFKFHHTPFKNSIFYLIIVIMFILTSISEFYFGSLNITLMTLWYISLGKMIYGKDN